jgi:hypothetical protein
MMTQFDKAAIPDYHGNGNPPPTNPPTPTGTPTLPPTPTATPKPSPSSCRP